MRMVKPCLSGQSTSNGDVRVIKILNLYAGIGGNRKLWGPQDVTAVEINPEIAKAYSDFYPDDKVIVGDAHEFLVNNYGDFDFIWASPPCPTHSTISTGLKGWGIVRYPDMKLYQEIILLKHFFEGKYVVENVVSYYRPLIIPEKFCRHYFWTNFNIKNKNIEDPTKGFIGNFVKSGTTEVIEYQRILGFDLSKYKFKNKRQVLRNCVLPELGKHIFDCAMGHMVKEEQIGLFA